MVDTNALARERHARDVVRRRKMRARRPQAEVPHVRVEMRPVYVVSAHPHWPGSRSNARGGFEDAAEAYQHAAYGLVHRSTSHGSVRRYMRRWRAALDSGAGRYDLRVAARLARWLAWRDRRLLEVRGG